MKICVLGKRASMLNWVESAVTGWRQAGHEVLHVVTRDPRLHPAVERALFAPLFGAPRAAAMARRIRAFAPDLIVAIRAFDMPVSLLAALTQGGLPPLFGWVGDVFDAEAPPRARYFAAIGYTDSGFVRLHRERGLGGAPLFFPHAANPAFAAAPDPMTERDPRLLFVASPTPLRRAVVAAIRQPIALYGGGWSNAPGGAHEVQARKIATGEVSALYRRHAAVLNIRNEQFVLGGLNQRSFDPYLAGACVLSDAQADLPDCFEPAAEVLVWRDAEDLNALYDRLLRNPSLAATVAARGRARVLADHTFTARLAAIGRAVGVRVA